MALTKTFHRLFYKYKEKSFSPFERTHTHVQSLFDFLYSETYMCVSALTETFILLTCLSCLSSNWRITMATVSQAQPLVTASSQSLHKYTQIHTQRAGAWAGQISAHQRQPHWPAYFCFKAPINFPLICLQVGGDGSDFRCNKATKGEIIWGNTALPFSSNSNTRWMIIMAFLKGAVICHLKVAALWDSCVTLLML